MKKAMIVSALLLAGVAGLTGCGKEKKSASVPALDPTNMDLSVTPGTDFYRFANGETVEDSVTRVLFRERVVLDRKSVV